MTVGTPWRGALTRRALQSSCEAGAIALCELRVRCGSATREPSFDTNCECTTTPEILQSTSPLKAMHHIVALRSPQWNASSHRAKCNSGEWSKVYLIMACAAPGLVFILCVVVELSSARDIRLLIWLCS